MTRKTRFKINIYRVNLRNPCLIFCYNRLEAQHAAPLLSQGLLYNLKYMEQLEHLSFKGQKARDNENVVTTARREGKEEGREEGIAIGKAEGRAEGILITARLMKQNGISFEQIKLCTGLSDEEIESL